jgi:hypothetical protein
VTTPAAARACPTLPSGALVAVSKVVRGAPVEVVGEPVTDQPTTEEEARAQEGLLVSLRGAPGPPSSRRRQAAEVARAVAGRLRSTARATASL